jgi:hypothetical protein
MAVGLPRSAHRAERRFRAAARRSRIDVASRRDPYPEWAQLGWLPVAGDGCGNSYILREDGTVGFVDTMQDPGKIDRQAASDLLSLMIGLLAHDRETGRASS